MRAPLTALLAVAALSPVAPAAAAGPAPGCAGLSFSDGSGDAFEDAFGLGFGPAAAARMDVLAGWLRPEEGRLIANIRVANLDTAPAPNGGTVAWTFNWFAGAQRFYAQATINANGTRAFSYGTYDESSATFRRDATVEVDGGFVEGPEGVVQIVLPERHAQGGLELERPFAETADEVGGGRAVTDRAPDAREGATYRVGGCLESGPAARAPRPRPARPAAQTLPLRAVAVIGSAGKASKRRSLGFKVRGLKTITKLKVRLTTPGGRVVAAGGLSRLKGVRALKLSLRKTVRLREGSYLLRATGKVRSRSLKAVLKVALRA